MACLEKYGRTRYVVTYVWRWHLSTLLLGYCPTLVQMLWLRTVGEVERRKQFSIAILVLLARKSDERCKPFLSALKRRHLLFRNGFIVEFFGEWRIEEYDKLVVFGKCRQSPRFTFRKFPSQRPRCLPRRATWSDRRTEDPIYCAAMVQDQEAIDFVLPISTLDIGRCALRTTLRFQCGSRTVRRTHPLPASLSTWSQQRILLKRKGLSRLM